VAVITNGTAVLGLGNIGPLAGKPVMEGKGVLFKKFAGVDVFDIEVNENDPDKLIDIIASLEPTFGGINLEDIKAPECFYIEKKLRERMRIPVFHDDQHGTAIISTAAVLNGLRVVGKEIEEVKLVCSGAGAAAIACVDLHDRPRPAPRERLDDRLQGGVIKSTWRDNLDPSKAQFAQDTAATTLAEIVAGADIFLGLSTAGVLKPEMVKTMADKPLILALANPGPGDPARRTPRQCGPTASSPPAVRIIPNQVNNVLCFPFIFRGALDVGATTITQEMELATVRAIADLAHAEQSDVVAAAYAGSDLRFGPEYLIPKPFDPRLIVKIAPAVAKAAMDSGVATRPIADFDATATAAAVRLSLRPADEAGVRRGQEEATSASFMPKARTSACCAPCRWWRRTPGPAHPDRAARGHRAPHQKCGLRIRPASISSCATRRIPIRATRTTGRPTTSSPSARASRPVCQIEMRRRHHPDRRHDDPQGGRRRHAVRHLRHACPAPALRRPGDRAARGVSAYLRHERPDAAEADGLHLRHLRQLRPDRRAAGRR
jgi:malic enzyme